MKYRITETKNEEGCTYFWPEYRTFFIWNKIERNESDGRSWWLCDTYEQAFAEIEKFDARRVHGSIMFKDAVRIYHL